MQSKLTNQNDNDETTNFLKKLLETDEKPRSIVPPPSPTASLEKQRCCIITEGIFTVAADSITGTYFQNLSGKELGIKFKASGCWKHKASGYECDARGNSHEKAGEGYLVSGYQTNCLVIQSPRGMSPMRKPEAFLDIEKEIHLKPMEIITFIRNEQPHFYQKWTGKLIIEWSLVCLKSN
ncbi:hypothetical protein [Anabaena azotica]|uniref:Uncharacterized protein n=1 Tax=Anabaena azotica FACHB-119 TaxID=947527 RepID=A0ABR8D892_9NOST|nr:hypothetical protein [Anabaena azotica]MBD2503161.1 hypothetical protein [Anabaena azotica FACHB-119]